MVENDVVFQSSLFLLAVRLFVKAMLDSRGKANTRNVFCKKKPKSIIEDIDT